MPVRGQAEHISDRMTSRNGRNRRPISCLPCRGRKYVAPAMIPSILLIHPTRLRCDRALPACGNCVNRGDITSCCYVPRKSDSRTKLQETSSLSDAAQARIDQLESLVFTLLKNDQQRQRQVETPSSRIEVENSRNGEGEIEHEESDCPVVTHETDKRVESGVTRSQSAINIGADYKQSLSVDDGHWSLLLNEVRRVPD